MHLCNAKITQGSFLRENTFKISTGEKVETHLYSPRSASCLCSDLYAFFTVNQFFVENMQRQNKEHKNTSKAGANCAYPKRHLEILLEPFSEQDLPRLSQSLTHLEHLAVYSTPFPLSVKSKQELTEARIFMEQLHKLIEVKPFKIS